MTSWNKLRRKIVNAIMLSLTGLCTLFAAGTLVFILGYLFVHGAKSLNWDFFTKLPTPVGETGGGMANAILGSAKLLLLATAIGVPIGFLGGVYLAEFGGTTFSFVVRYTTDLLNGVPSIVMGIFAYTMIVLPQKHFSTFAGGVALGVMMIPIAIRSSEEFLRAVPLSLREGAMALGRVQSQGDLHGGDPGGEGGDRHRNHAEPGACGWRNGAAAVYQLQQSLLEPGVGTAHRRSSGDDFQLCRGPLRRLASAGLVCRVRFADSGPGREYSCATDSFQECACPQVIKCRSD